MNGLAVSNKLNDNGKRPLQETATVNGTQMSGQDNRKKVRFDSPDTEDDITVDEEHDAVVQELKAGPDAEISPSPRTSSPSMARDMPNNIFLPTPGILYMSSSDDSSEGPCIAMVLPYSAQISFPTPQELSSEYMTRHETDLAPTIRSVCINNVLVDHFGWDLMRDDAEEKFKERLVPVMILSGTLRNAWVPLRSLILLSQNPGMLREIEGVDEALDMYGEIRARNDLQTIEKIMDKKREDYESKESLLDQLLATEAIENRSDNSSCAIGASDDVNTSHTASEHELAPLGQPGQPEEAFRLPAVPDYGPNSTNAEDTANARVTTDNGELDKTGMEGQLQQKQHGLMEDDVVVVVPETRLGRRGPSRQLSPSMFVEQYPIVERTVPAGQEFFIQAYWLGSSRLWSGTDSGRFIRLVENVALGILQGSSRDTVEEDAVTEYGAGSSTAIARRGPSRKVASADMQIQIDPRNIEAMSVERSGKADTCVVKLQATQKRLERLQFRSRFIAADHRTVPSRTQARRFVVWVAKMNASVRHDDNGSTDAARGRAQPRSKEDEMVTID